MSRLQCFHGRIVELRRRTNAHLYGRRPLGPTDRYDLWIKPSDGVGRERKFTINTRTMPARRGHDVSIILTSHKLPQVPALANWGTIDGVNYARSDAASLVRVWDFILLPLALLGVAVSVGDVGMVLFVPGIATCLAAACAMRAVARSRRAFAADRAIDLEAWRINQQRLTFH